MRIGIDWGTHSSKWAYFAHGRFEIGSVVSSNLNVQDGTLSLTDSGEIIGLKREAISNTGLAWTNKYGATDVPYQALVVFSIASLIRAALVHRQIVEKAELLDLMRDSEIRFSFPNWIGNEMAPAFAGFRSAVTMAVRMVLENPDSVPAIHEPADLTQYLKAYEGAREALPGYSLSDDPMKVSDVIERGGVRVRVRYIMESVAAGLPALEYLESLRDAGHRAIRYRRLLIVDSGAGSTDMGYVVLYREKEDENYYFVYFPPCRQVPLGGNWLTDRLWASMGKDKTSFSKAEGRKIELSTKYAGEPELFNEKIPETRDWVAGITQPAMRYVSATPKHTHMHQNIPIDLVMTGGSSIVPGLSAGLLNSLPTAVKAAIMKHGPSNLDFPVQSRNLTLFQKLLPAYQKADSFGQKLGITEQARRAVVHGLCMDLRHLITYDQIPNRYFRCDGDCADPGQASGGKGNQWVGPI